MPSASCRARRSSSSRRIRSCSRRRFSFSKNSSRSSSRRRRPSAVRWGLPWRASMSAGWRSRRTWFTMSASWGAPDTSEARRRSVSSEASGWRMIRSSTKWSSVDRLTASSSPRARGGLVEEADDVVGRQEREGLPGGGPDLGVLVGHDREERPHPVVSLERQKARGPRRGADRGASPETGRSRRDPEARVWSEGRARLPRGKEPRASFASGAGPARACHGRPGPRFPGAPWRGRRR